MTQKTKAKDCCYGVRPLSDCQCEKDRLAALAATPALNDDDLVSRLRERAKVAREEMTGTSLGDALHFEDAANEIERLRLAAPPAVGGEIQPHIYMPDYQAMGDCRVCGHEQDKTWHVLAAPPASPLRGRETELKDSVRGAVARGWCSRENEEKEFDACLASLIFAEVWAEVAAALASPPEQPAPFQPHENCNCLMCIAEKPRDES